MGGGFASSGFSDLGFNTGSAVVGESPMAPPDNYSVAQARHYERVKREDEEILAIILATAASGILDE